MSNQSKLKQILADVLKIDTSQFTAETLLLGAIPEFDSMAVMLLLIEFEKAHAFDIENTELSVDNFLSFGQLENFVKQFQVAAQ
ncbi:MAG: acyl carrier protein [Colwellia sp.]